MADKKLRALVFPIGSVGLVQEIDPGLDSMQSMVGEGYIQMVPYNYNTTLVCNEEGKLNGQQPNRPAWGGRDVIFGPFFFVGPADDEGESISLTDEQIQKLKEEFDG